jgi:hypothetical protein
MSKMQYDKSSTGSCNLPHPSTILSFNFVAVAFAISAARWAIKLPSVSKEEKE